MAKSNGAKGRRETPPEPALSRITVAGFKSIGPERSIDIRPLTLLAGANSSGKSSMMQPLLLLKQTLEAPYDPGALLLDGPHVKFTNVDQMFFRPSRHAQTEMFSIGLTVLAGPQVTAYYRRAKRKPIDIESMTYQVGDTRTDIRPGDYEFNPQDWNFKHLISSDQIKSIFGSDVRTRVFRSRCFLDRVLQKTEGQAELPHTSVDLHPVLQELYGILFEDPSLPTIESSILDTIHLPGWRGTPQRAYPITATGPRYPGTFENYVASIVARSVVDKQKQLLEQIGDNLRTLGLTWTVSASAVNDTQVELKVGRMYEPARGGAHDLVNIADVGFGVSQTLPVVVALQVARPGQLVYIEQPELHLHPRAQVAMARLLANAANRGVRVVAETHSSLLLVGVQSLVAEEVLAPDKVKLHWFERNKKDGSTDIRSADLDAAGAYGDWPVDFFDVSMDASLEYTRAAFEQLKNGSHAQESPASPRR
jgi:predicted ATPase